jgi:hypothetical protein
VTGMSRFFTHASYGVLTAASISMAVGITKDEVYWIFDSHSRNALGFLTPKRNACLAMSQNLQTLCEMFQQNVVSGNVQYTIEMIEIIDQVAVN